MLSFNNFERYASKLKNNIISKPFLFYTEILSKRNFIVVILMSLIFEKITSLDYGRHIKDNKPKS